MKDRDPGAVLHNLARLSSLELSTVIETFVTTCDLELQHFMEIGVILEPRGLSVVTLGRGRSFGDRVGQMIVDWGLDQDPRELINDLQRSLDTSMLIKVATDVHDRPEIDLYFRKTKTLEDTVRWLSDHSVNESEQHALLDLGRLAGTDQTGILGASFRTGKPSLFKAYIHTRSGNGVSLGERLHACFEHFKIPGTGWRRMLERLDTLNAATEADAYVSLLLGDGDAFDSLKLDLFHVELKAFENLALECGLLSSSAASIRELGSSIGLTCAEHCGFRFSDLGKARLTAYFSADSDQIEA